MADWLNINSLLNSYQNSLTQRATLGVQDPSFDPARSLLINSNVNWETPPDQLTGKSNRGGPSVISRIFDILSRPRYAIAETTRQFAEKPEKGQSDLSQAGDVLGGFFQGLAGKKKTSWSDVISEAEYNLRPEQFQKPTNPNDFKHLDPNYKGPDKLSQGAITGFGLAGDLLIDPVNLIGPGTIKSGVSGVRKALGLGKAAKATEEAVRPGTSITKATKVIPPTETPIPEQSLFPTGQSLPAGLDNLPNIQKFADQLGNLNVMRPRTTNDIDELGNILGISNLGARSIDELSPNQWKYAQKGFDEGLVNKLVPNEVPGPTINELTRPKINLPTSGLANESILSPAVRALNDAGNFPQVKIPTQESAVGKTNPQIRDLIKEIADTAGTNRPKYIGKMNKQELSYTLKTIQKNAGRDALSAATQTEKLPKAAPKLNVALATTKMAKENEVHTALNLAQKYEDDVLSKPNKFPTPGRDPAVNNPAQQVNFFNNKILPAARDLYPKRNKQGQYAVALNMLKHAEDAFEAKGMHPAFWSGVPFKLSDVIERMGGYRAIKGEHLTRIMTALGNQDSSKITDPKIKSVVEGLISEQKLKETPYIEQALNKSVNEAAVGEQIFSQPKYEEFKNIIAQTQRQELKTPKSLFDLAPNVPLYITKPGADLANKTLKQIFKESVPLPQRAINKNLETVQQFIRSNGTSYWAPVNRAVTQAIHETIGGPSSKELGTKIGAAANVENWILSRFSTAYGNKDLRPAVLIAQQTGKARAAKRAKVLNQIAKGYNANQIQEAFKVAQGGMRGSTPEIDALADDFQRMLENMFDTTSIGQKGNSVAYRTGMVMRDINQQLKIMKAGFKFTDAKNVPDLLGGSRDFSQGNDWLKSWQVAQPHDPLVFMSKIQSAVENVVAKNSFLDDFASRWGNRFYDPRNGFTHKLSDPRLKGLYYNKELAQQMGTVLKNWDQVYDPKSPLVRLFDQATSLWKTGMTVYMPAHHIRNMIGDVYMSWMDGVNTMKPYRIASKVLWSQRNRYNDLQNLETLVSPKSISAALTRPGDNVLRTKSGLDVTAEQLYTAAFNTGLLQNANAVEDIMTDVIPKFKPLRGKISKPVRGFSEGREHYARMAHFVDIVSKSRNKNLEQVFEEASKRVRKWHPDGMDLTNFERKYLRRVMPFYSWTRKSIPLVIESAVTRPGKTMAYPKIMYGAQQFAGTPGASIDDPFPEDQLFPDWIKEKGIGPIGSQQSSGLLGAIAGFSRSRPGFTGDREGYTIINPSNPFIDTISQFAGMGRLKDTRSGIAQSINPFFRIPAELGTGTTALGTPVDYDPNKYVTENIPLLSYLSQLGNIGIAGPTERGQQEGIGNSEGIVNFLTALGLRGSGASIKQAEFEARERAKKSG